MLQLKSKTMINNSINIAQYKLKLHKDKGMQSELSIEEVAQLMDLIHFGEEIKKPKTNSIFFQFSAN